MAVTRKPVHELPGANAILTDDRGQEMQARYDEDTQRWTIALPCGQVSTGIRQWSINDRILNRGWSLSS